VVVAAVGVVVGVLVLKIGCIKIIQKCFVAKCVKTEMFAMLGANYSSNSSQCHELFKKLDQQFLTSLT